ncbi:hypothetical protein ACI3LY_000857 [Candidozyma auris]|nr:hypothetical protein QG37_02604 [[Candida] auris]PIS57172.1 hypothetical protein CJI97_000199 [[Candida] auris]
MQYNILNRLPEAGVKNWYSVLGAKSNQMWAMAHSSHTKESPTPPTPQGISVREENGTKRVSTARRKRDTVKMIFSSWMSSCSVTGSEQCGAVNDAGSKKVPQNSKNRRLVTKEEKFARAVKESSIREKQQSFLSPGKIGRGLTTTEVSMINCGNSSIGPGINNGQPS